MFFQSEYGGTLGLVAHHAHTITGIAEVRQHMTYQTSDTCVSCQRVGGEPSAQN